MKLVELEKEHNFTYPALYKQLEKDGMLDVGEYDPTWHTVVFPKLKDNPTLLLHSNDFELLSVKASGDALQQLKGSDDYRQIKPEFTFIPFGQNGSGDYYCFLVSERTGDDYPIVQLWHDENEAIYLAKNLQDFIFRSLLTDMSQQDVFNDVSDEEFKNNIKATLKTHAKYVSKQQSDILEEIAAREIFDYEIELPSGRKEEYRGLLTHTELQSLLAELAPYPKTDMAFEYADE